MRKEKSGRYTACSSLFLFFVFLPVAFKHAVHSSLPPPHGNVLRSLGYRTLPHVLRGTEPLSHDEVEDGEDVDEQQDGTGHGQGEDGRSRWARFEERHVGGFVVVRVCGGKGAVLRYVYLF